MEKQYVGGDIIQLENTWSNHSCGRSTFLCITDLNINEKWLHANYNCKIMYPATQRELRENDFSRIKNISLYYPGH